MKYNCFVDKNRFENLLNELHEDIGVKYNEYVVWFSNEDSIKLRIKQDINRPNNSEDYELIVKYISENYKPMPYEIIEIDAIECIKI